MQNYLQEDLKEHFKCQTLCVFPTREVTRKSSETQIRGSNQFHIPFVICTPFLANIFLGLFKVWHLKLAVWGSFLFPFNTIPIKTQCLYSILGRWCFYDQISDSST